MTASEGEGHGANKALISKIGVYRIPVPKDRLRALTKDERVLLLLLGYASNQVSMLQKLLTFATNRTPEAEIEQHATGVQTQMLVRLTVGAVNEAWRLITTRFIENPLQKEYAGRLDAGGQQAFEALKRQFGKSNLLVAVRNDFGFHYPSSDDAEKAFTAAAADPTLDDLWSVYFSAHGFNSLFFLSDLIFAHGIGGKAGSSDITVAHQKLMGELSTASMNVVEFARAFFAAVWVKNFGDVIDARDKVQIQGAPNIDDVTLPFFVEVPPPETKPTDGAKPTEAV